MSAIIKHKKIIFIVVMLLLSPFLIPLIQMIGQIIFEGGRLIGNLIRSYSGMC